MKDIQQQIGATAFECSYHSISSMAE